MTLGLERITQQAEVMGGKACIRGMRVTVGMVVSQIGAGRSIEEILADYPYLEREDHLAGATLCSMACRRTRGHAGQWVGWAKPTRGVALLTLLMSD